MRKRRDWPELQPDGDALSLSTLVAEYLVWLETRAYSKRSIHRGRWLLSRFVLWCHERGISRPTEVTKPALEHYQRWLFYFRHHDGKTLSVRNQAQHLSTVRSLFKWLAKQNHILSNPASDLEMPRLDHPLPRNVLSVEEVEMIMCQPDLETSEGFRDRAILEVLYSTGMRRMEVANLSVYDVDAQRRTVHIRLGKGKRDRIIPIGSRALSWVKKYVEDVRPTFGPDAAEQALFLTRDGKPLPEDNVTVYVGKYVRKAGLTKAGASHMFRHSMATMMLENGADIRFIQAMLGHADLSTTQIYTRVSIEKLQEVYRATHPGAEERKSQASVDEK